MATTRTVPGLEELLAGLGLSTPVPQFASSDVLNKPVDLVRSYLADLLSSLVDCDPTAAYSSVQQSTDSAHGDLTVVLPRLCPGVKGAKAGELAAEIIKKFATNPLFDLPWADGVYLRFCIKPGALPRLFLPYINERKELYGRDVSPNQDSPNKVVVEFSSPNIASEFQGKHLRSTIIGAFVSNIYHEVGWDVTKVNYLGDWGKDIALLGVGWEKFGSEDEFAQDPVSHLLEVYHKIHEQFLPEQDASRKARDEAKKSGQDELEVTAEIEGKGLFAERNAFFKRLEEGDDEALALSRRIRDVNIDNYSNFYARLGIRFDEYSGESQVSQEAIAEVEQLLKDKGITEESGGASVIDMKKQGGKAGMAIVRTRTGSSTYFLRYLAAVLERYRKDRFDKMIFVAADRTGHFLRLFKVFEALGMAELAEKLEHVQFSDASHMAEKLGHGYQPHGILDQCEKAMADVLKSDDAKAELVGKSDEAAKGLAITAVLAQEVATKRGTDHSFDIASMTSFKSGTGPDLQYQYARLVSVLAAHPYTGELAVEHYQTLAEEAHTSLVLALGQYPEIVDATFRSLEPSHVMAYLHSVVDKLADCLDEEEDEAGGAEGAGEEGEGAAKGQEDLVTPAQSALYEATRTVLENGMKLVGLIPAELQPHRADTPIAG